MNTNRYTEQPRFASKYVPVSCGCWLWIAALDDRGSYGWMWFRGRSMGAHRVSWELHRGPIPNDMCVLHHCDVPSCVNPEHLFLGTNADNVADMMAKGRDRYLSGEQHGNAKLTKEIAVLIRADTRPQRQIATAYGLGQATVWRVKRGETWK